MTRKGFTLIEVLLAATIFALVAAAALAFLDSSRRLDEKIHFKSEILQTGRAVLSFLERDLRGAFASNGKFGTGIIGTDLTTGDEPTDEIELVSANHHAQTDEDREIDLSRTIYKIDEERGLVRMKIVHLTQEAQVINADDITQDVSARVISLDVRYHDGEGWTGSWNTEETKTMPKAIEITIKIEATEHGKIEVETMSKSFWLPVGQNFKHTDEEGAAPQFEEEEAIKEED